MRSRLHRPEQTGAWHPVFLVITADGASRCCKMCSASYKQPCVGARSRWYGPEAPRWLGPLPYEYPDWLPEEAPANYRFDPAALSLPEV